MGFRRGLVSVSVFEASDLDSPRRRLHDALRPNGLYPVRYPLNFGTSTDSKGNTTEFLLSSYASNITRLFAVRLEDYAFNSGHASTVVRLTPVLADGEVRHLVRAVRATGYIENEIAVGLSRESWSVGTLNERRMMVVSAITRAVKLAAQREGWSVDIPEIVKEKFDKEQRELTGFTDDPRSRIETPQSLLRALSMTAWRGLGAEQQQTVSAALTDVLAACGRNLRFLGVNSFGPDFDQQAVAQWQDLETMLCFSLVPGGEFRPGYDVQRLGEYEKIYNRLFSMTIRDAQEAGEAEGVLCRPDSVCPYGSMGPCDIRAKSHTTVSPFLMACSPVTQGMNSARRLADPKTIREYGNSGNSAVPLYLEWGEVTPILRQHGWTLPSSAEMELAIGANRPGLFYWGDEPHKAILAFHSEEKISEEEGEEAFDLLLHGTFEFDRPRVWPWVNRLGLAGVLTQSTWCRPDLDPNSLYPLIHRGGAAACFPWQYCGEWQLLLTAAESLTTLDGRLGGHRSATIRPILRFVEGH